MHYDKSDDVAYICYKPRFAIFPHRCKYSREWIWFKNAYKEIVVYEYWYGSDVNRHYETNWVSEREFLLLTLKK